MINNIFITGSNKIDNYYYAFNSVGEYQRNTFSEGNYKYEIDSDGHIKNLIYNIPVYYNQKDPRWAYNIYGIRNFGSTGCVPTSLAMAFETLLKRTISPKEIGDYLYYNTDEFNKYYPGAGGLAIIYATNRYGVNRTGISNTTELKERLMEGKIVYASMGNGKFATIYWNHAIIMSGLRNGHETYAIDPLRSDNNGWIDINEIWNQKCQDPDDMRGGYYLYALY